MNRDRAIAILRAHEGQLRAAGVERLSIFGSVARGDAGPGSDVDILVRLSPDAQKGGLAYFGRLADLTHQLEQILGCSVDVIVEPVQKEALREAAEREAAPAF
jgi:uncharacterized protein